MSKEPKSPKCKLWMRHRWRKSDGKFCVRCGAARNPKARKL